MKRLPKLRPMDVVLTGDRGIVPAIIKMVSIFSRRRRKRKHKGWRNTANHVGLVVELNQLMAHRYSNILGYWVSPGANIAEMSIPINGSYRDAKAIISPISKYQTRKFWKPRIVEIKRFPIYDDSYKRNLANIRVLRLVGKVIYDYLECLEVAFNRFEDDPQKMICSRFVYDATKDDVEWPARFSDVITPLDIQIENNSRTIYDA